ncbi:cytochrome P450 [Aspergillus heteromorphus CBS 117.55]|uniref:Cytochrome P450 n=1 Tax=Aspergillus heteromorphus CBS 117.55 TaxID=1448321 RepID=A0A317V951_9EURO|nr:cytochrome P450 [Aspergillus heteromorphus CBS 117.55]PWY70903.1 cytochrome P450 [Aspergillus heteromorphus CBS 117.55]
MVLQVLYLVVYYTILHPLAQYPGPFLARFTNLYSAYHAWTGDIHLDIYRCHQKYGDHVRYAPNRLLINTAGALHDIYDRHAHVKKFKNYRVLSKQAPNTLTLRDKVQHSRRRRVLSQAFSKRGVESMQPIILARLERLSEVLRSQVPDSSGWTSPIDMAQICKPTLPVNHLAFDTMTSVSFGIDFDAMRDPKYRYVMDAIDESNVRQGVLFQAEGLSTAKLDRRLFPASIVAASQFSRFIRRLLATRLQTTPSTTTTTTTTNDIFSFLQQCQDPKTGESLTLTELSTETATFIVAGSDTNSTTLSALTHYLTGSSTSYLRLKDEIRGTFDTLAEISLGPKLNSCVFLRACISESLRLSPPGGSSLWREVEAGGTVIDGTFVPGGCEVGVGIYSIHHCGRYYSDPGEFEPERWIVGRGRGSEGEDKWKDGVSPYMPFSIGPRSCIGKPLAMAQVMLTVARMVWEFELRRAELGEEWVGTGVRAEEYVLEDHVTARKRGPVVCLRGRE